MHVFLTGATGLVGSAVLSQLLAAGHRVTGLARSEDAATALVAAGADPHRGDLGDLDSLGRGAAQADAVIHTAFDHDFSRFAETSESDRRAIEALGQALAGSDRRLVVTAGLPPIAGRPATEEDAPPAGAAVTPRMSEQAALALVDRGVRASVVRMAQVHDYTKQGFGSFLLDHALEKGVSAYVGDGGNRWPAVHRLDAARLYVSVLQRGVAGGRYHAVAEDGVPVRAVAEAIGRRLQLPVTSLSPAQSADHFGWLDRIVRMDVPASSTLTRERLGWEPVEHAGLVADIEQSR